MAQFFENLSRIQLLIESQNCMSNNENDKAIHLLKEAYLKSSTPNEIYPILHLIGVCFLNQENYLDANHYFLEALEVQFNVDKEMLRTTYYCLGVSYYYLKDFNNAIIFLTKYIDINPDLMQAFMLRGNSYQKTGNYQGAITDLEIYFGKDFKIEEIEEIEDNIKPVLALSNSYVQTNNFVDGIKLLIKASKIAPNDNYVKIALKNTLIEYFSVDDFEIPTMLIKGKLFYQITCIVNTESRKEFSNVVQLAFIEVFEKEKRMKSTILTMDIINIGSYLSKEFFREWEKTSGPINNIHKSYIVFEVSTVIHNYEFFVMDIDELHRRILSLSLIN